MIRQAVSYSLQGSWKIRVIAGGAAITFMWTLIPMFILIGYFSRAVTGVSLGAHNPPAIDNVMQLVRNGAIGFGVIATLTSLMLALPFLSAPYFISTVSGPITDQTPLINLSSLTGGIMLIVAIVLLFAPVILCQYSRYGVINSVAQLKQLAQLAISPVIWKAIGETVILTVVTALLTGVLVGLTLGIGVIALPVIGFWLLTTTMYLYGHAFGIATGSLRVQEQLN